MSTYLIAAVPDSKFLREAYELLQVCIIEGTIPHNDIFGFIQHNSNVGIDFVPSSIASVMTSLVYSFNSQPASSQGYREYYRIQSPKRLNFKDLSRFSSYLMERIVRG